MEGHTDGVGGDDYNQHLSEQRAGAARDYLVQNGIASNNVSAAGFGKTKPVTRSYTAAVAPAEGIPDFIAGDYQFHASSRSFLMSAES